MPIGTGLHRSQLRDRYDTIVIGSGIGGLTTAAILAKAGHKVLVLERHYTAGGFTHTFSRKGYEWDVGVHYIGEVQRKKSPIRKIFDYITDGQLQWEEMPKVYDKICLGEESFDYVKGEAAFIQRMISYFPDQAVAIRSYVNLVKKVSRLAGPHFALQLLPTWLAKPLYPLLGRGFRSYAKQSTQTVLEGVTSDKKLQAVLAGQWGDYGLPPSQSSFAMHALVARHYLHGASYPVGGSSRIAESVSHVLQKYGTDLVTRAEVREILCEGKVAVGVKLADGRSIFARNIVSAVGAQNTFLRLLPKDHSERRYYETKLGRLSPSMAHVCLYIGLKAELEDLNIPSSNLWIYQDSDHEKVRESLEGNFQGQFPLVYISFPSAKDPTWKQRFPGKSTIELVAPMPFQWFQPWSDSSWQKRGETYQKLKEQLTRELLAILCQKFPQLDGKIHYSELSTPLSTRHFNNYEHGEIYGLSHCPTRFTQSWLRSDTRIPRLFLSGQDLVTCGIGGAMSAGVLTAVRILGPWRGYKALRLL